MRCCQIYQHNVVFLLFQLQAEDIKKVADYVSQLRRVGKGHGEAGRCGGLLGCMQMLLPTAVRRECVSWARVTVRLGGEGSAVGFRRWQRWQGSNDQLACAEGGLPRVGCRWRPGASPRPPCSQRQQRGALDGSLRSPAALLPPLAFRRRVGVRSRAV